MRRFLIIVLVVLLNIQLNAQWVKTNGPEGGDIYSLLTNGTNLFVGTYGGGVFLSTDDGAHWVAARNGLETRSVLALASIGTTIFAGTNGPGVFASTDSGKNWASANSGLTNRDVRSLVASGTDLFAGTWGNGIFRSTNNGATWTSSATGLTNLYIYSLCSVGADLYTGTDGGGVHRSTDNGATWTAINNGLTNTIIYGLAGDGANLYAATWGGGVFHSTDNGASWSSASSGLINPDVRSLMIDGTWIYAGTNNGISRSTNNGTTWTDANSGVLDREIGCFALSGSVVVVGTRGGGVAVSSDNGANWTTANIGLTAAEVHAFATKESYLFAGVFGGGAFRSDNGGNSWTAKNSGLTNTHVTSFLVNGTSIFAGTVDGIFVSTNDGNTWSPLNNGLDNGYVFSLAAKGGDIYAGTWGGGVFRTTNLGTNWSQSNNGLTNLQAWSLAVLDSSIFVGTQGNGVFRSTDGAATWAAANSGISGTAVWSLTSIENVLFAGTQSTDGVFVSSDNGGSWVTVNTGLPNLFVSSLAAKGRNLFVSTYLGVACKFVHSTGWQNIGSGQIQKGVHTLAARDSFLFMAYGGDGIWRRRLSELLFSISGNVFNDLNANHARDTGEAGIPNWRIRLFIGADQVDSVLTDSAGNYLFTDLPWSTYDIRQQAAAGWKATFPTGSGLQTAVLFEGGSNVTGKNFASYEISSINGTVFNDLNANTVKDLSDTGLIGWRMRLAKDGVPLDSVLTNSTGDYTFTDLPTGNYTVSQNMQIEWYQTLPTLFRPYNDTITTGGTILTGRDFGDVYQFPFANPGGGNWSDTKNWPGSAAPGPTTPVVIPAGIIVTVDKLPNDSIQAIRLVGNGTLTFADTVGQLRVAGNVSIDTTATMQFPETNDTTGLICYANLINKGYFLPGHSTVTLAGDGRKEINSSESKTHGSMVFYNLDVSGDSARIQGNISVRNRLSLMNDIEPRDQDTVLIDTSALNVIQDTGRIVRGTLIRKIAQGETGIYRFESPSTYLQFDGSGSYPPSVAMTTLPDSMPPSHMLRWEAVGGTVDTVTNSIRADSVAQFSRWALGIPRPQLAMDGIVSVSRQYIIHPSGGNAYAARVVLRYGQLEVLPGVSESELILLRGPWVVDTVDSRWNMVSLPLFPETYIKSTLFSAASSDAFAFAGTYTPQSVLDVGRGYWLKFPSASHVSIKGDDMGRNEVPVQQGWNLIGSISYPVRVASSVTSEPSGIFPGGFFGYDNGYHRADMLLPIHAYWVKASSAGKVILAMTDTSELAQFSTPKSETKLGSLTIHDAAGFAQQLFFGHGNRFDHQQAETEMPPPPPIGVFDARYATGRITEVANGTETRFILLSITSAEYPLKIRWNVPDGMSVDATLQVGAGSLPLTAGGSVDVTDPSVVVGLVLAASSEERPSTFALYDNYPNPFNPSTTLKYALPFQSKVSVKVYDLIGREVGKILEGIVDAGYHEVAWDASGVGTGIYYCRFWATGVSDPTKGFTQIQKMILMK